MKTPKVPRTPPAALRREPSDIVAVQPPLWRIHRTSGSYPLQWDALRAWGPIPSMRFDPQPLPVGEHSDGVLYAATDFTTALAEVFQTTRCVDIVNSRPCVTVWVPTRPLRLLDLTGSWALRNGGSYALAAAPRSTCRTWARKIRVTWPDLDGLWTPSTMTGQPIVVLWNPSVDSFPTSPMFSRPLSEPTIALSIARIASEKLGYDVA